MPKIDFTEEEISVLWKMLNQVNVQGLDSMKTVLDLAFKISQALSVNVSLNGSDESLIPRK